MVATRRPAVVDVNTLLESAFLHAPRRRWLAVNTDFYGPHFTLVAFLDVRQAELAAILEPLDWLRALRRGSTWLHRPTSKLDRRRCPFDYEFPGVGATKKEQASIREMILSTLPRRDTVRVVWWYIDPHGPPSDNGQPGDMIPPRTPLRAGWVQMDAAERAGVTAATADSKYGALAPQGGWGEVDVDDALAASSTRASRTNPSTAKRTKTPARSPPPAPTKRARRAAASDEEELPDAPPAEAAPPPPPPPPLPRLAPTPLSAKDQIIELQTQLSKLRHENAGLKSRVE